MDTDDFSERAWAAIVQAAKVSDTLKAELGAISMKCVNEDDWLQEVREYLQAIIEAPDEYVEFWDLEGYESVTATMIGELATQLCSQLEKVQAIPLGERGKR